MLERSFRERLSPFFPPQSEREKSGWRFGRRVLVAYIYVCGRVVVHVCELSTLRFPFNFLDAPGFLLLHARVLGFLSSSFVLPSSTGSRTRLQIYRDVLEHLSRGLAKYGWGGSLVFLHLQLGLRSFPPVVLLRFPFLRYLFSGVFPFCVAFCLCAPLLLCGFPNFPTHTKEGYKAASPAPHKARKPDTHTDRKKRVGHDSLFRLSCLALRSRAAVQYSTVRE